MRVRENIKSTAIRIRRYVGPACAMRWLLRASIGFGFVAWSDVLVYFPVMPFLTTSRGTSRTSVEVELSGVLFQSQNVSMT
jgi:hypothetical protein